MEIIQKKKQRLYTDMIDYTKYSIHPKCERTLLFASYNTSEFNNRSVCRGAGSPPTKDRDIFIISRISASSLTST
jgi:hypothetical protein